MWARHATAGTTRGGRRGPWPTDPNLWDTLSRRRCALPGHRRRPQRRGRGLRARSHRRFLQAARELRPGPAHRIREVLERRPDVEGVEGRVFGGRLHGRRPHGGGRRRPRAHGPGGEAAWPFARTGTGAGDDVHGRSRRPWSSSATPRSGRRRPCGVGRAVSSPRAGLTATLGDLFVSSTMVEMTRLEAIGEEIWTCAVPFASWDFARWLHDGGPARIWRPGCTRRSDRRVARPRSTRSAP